MQRRVLIAPALLLGDVAVTVLLFAHAWAHPAASTIGRRTDAPYTVWAMSWVARALAHGQSPLVTHSLSWPGGVNLMTNATIAGLGIVLAPVTWLWGALVAFNVAATAALALTAWSVQLVLHRTGLISWPAAAIGGVVAGFAPLSIAQEGGAHVHVTALFLVPPILLGVGRVVSGTARYPGRWGVALGALAAAELMVGEEVLAITAISAVVGIAVAAVMRFPIPWRTAVQALAAGATVFMLLATWPLWVQFAGTAHITGAIQHGSMYPNDLTGFITPSDHMWVTGGWVAHSFSSEGGVYLGIPLLCVAVAAVVRWWSEPVVRIVGLTAAVLAVLSLGDTLSIAGYSTGIPMPWAIVGHLPVLDSLIPVRFGVVIDLAAGALLALAIDTTASRRPARPRGGRHFARRRSLRTTVMPAVVTLVCLIPIVPKLPFPTSAWAIPAAFRSPSRAAIPDGSLILLGPYPAVTAPEVEIWLAAAGDRWRSAGGSYFVPGKDGRVTIGGEAPLSAVIETRISQGGRASPKELPQVRAQLAHDHVAAVVIGPMARRDRVLAFWTSLLGPPRTVGDVAVYRVA